jgi:RimJ/RimL family protein N-acetyltransferase
MKYLLTGEETERLEFRLLNESDFETWLPLFDNKDVARFLALDETKSKQELCEFWFEKAFNRYKNDLGGMNVLIEKSTGNFIGQCGLLVQEIDGETRLEVGYSMLPKYWGRGFASEAAIKCKEFAFEYNFADSIISVIHPDNIGSRKVAIRNGMSLKKQTEFHGMPAQIFEVLKKQLKAKK